MYVAAVYQAKTRIQDGVDRRMLRGWLDQSPEALWIDLIEPAAEDLSFLQERFGLHPLAVEECDHTGVRPKIEQFENHLYLVMHGINHNPGEDALRTVEFKIFLWKEHLVTVHDRPSSSVRATQERLQRDAQLLARSGPDTVLQHVLDLVVDHYFPVVEELESQIEKVEAAIFTETRDDLLEQMLRLQRKVLTLHRLMHPQLDILGALASGRYPEIDPVDLAYFRDVYDHLQRIGERVQICRELLATSMQCYLSHSANRMSAGMKGLAVLAALALPATFLTSFLSMNLESLPGRHYAGTFWAIAASSLVLTLAMLVLLRRMRWI